MRVWLLFALLLVPSLTAHPEENPIPLARAHSHNDYEHARPLFDALDYGFCSVEADIWLVDGKLLVAHDEKDLKPERTLQALYLDPLLKRVRENGGRVFRDGPPVTLLIDLKSVPVQTLAALRETLKPYAEMLTSFTRDSTEERAVSVIVSGVYNRKIVVEQSPRFDAADGRLPHLGKSPHDVPLVSENWASVFTWKGAGEMPATELAKLRDLIARAHAAGQRIRFWNLPPRDEVLNLLYDEGVDLLNADDLAAMQAFLRGKMSANSGEKS